MQIFHLHPDPAVNATLHCNKHVVKIPLEIAQLCYTAWHLNKGPDVAFPDVEPRPEKHYRPSHKNHPLALWVRQSQENYQYAIQLGLALCQEYTARYGRVMKPECNLRYLAAAGFPTNAESLKRRRTRVLSTDGPEQCSGIPLCFDEQFVITDGNEVKLYESYRMYYRSKEPLMDMKWGTEMCPREKPEWF